MKWKLCKVKKRVICDTTFIAKLYSKSSLLGKPLDASRLNKSIVDLQLGNSLHLIEIVKTDSRLVFCFSKSGADTNSVFDFSTITVLLVVRNNGYLVLTTKAEFIIGVDGSIVVKSCLDHKYYQVKIDKNLVVTEV